jgi:DNA invertase Pin-like site-specific DNA recombinase
MATKRRKTKAETAQALGTVERPKAYSYLRWSTPDQERGDSFRRQTHAAQDYADRYGLALQEDSKYHDKGVSAFRGRNSASGQLNDFLGAVRAGDIPRGSYLLVENLDRISRQAAWDAMNTLRSLVEEDVTVVSLQDGKRYSRETLVGDPFAMMMAVLGFMRANEESETKSRRLRAVWTGKRARANEKPLTATCPGWLTLDKDSGRFSIDKDRAKVVKRIFKDTRKGIGKHSIAAALNREGVAVFGGAKHWHRSYVAKILGSSTVIGTYTPHIVEYIDGKKTRKPQKPIANYYPAVVSRDLFDRVQAQLLDTAAPLRGRHAEGELRNVLGGLAVCGRCGATVTRVYKGAPPKGGEYLVCTKAKAGAGCRYEAIRYASVERALVENIPRICGTAPAGDKGADLDARLEQVEASIDGANDALERVLNAIEKHGHSTALGQRLREIESVREELRKERDEVEARAVATTGAAVWRRIGDVKRLVTTNPLDRREANAAMRQVFSKVAIDRPNGQLVFHWKHGGDSSAVFAWPSEED